MYSSRYKDAPSHWIRKQIEKGDNDLNEKFRYLSDLLGGNSNFVRTIKNYTKLLDLDNHKDK